MVACVAVRESLCAEWPSPNEARFFCGQVDNGHPSPLAPATDFAHLQLNFRSDVDLPQPPAMSCTSEDSCADSRQRFRTASSVGMPISPWSPFTGERTFGAPSLDTSIYAPPQCITPFVQPEYFTGFEEPWSSFIYPDGAVYFGGEVWGFEEHLPAADFAPTEQAQCLPEPDIAPIAAEEPPQAREEEEAQPAATSSGEPRTTVMLRNLPSGFTRITLTDFLDSQGFAGRYDFAYLPVNFDTLSSLSHAFVNMVAPADAERLRKHLEGFREWATPSDCVCQVVWNDKHQGLTALVERYRNSPVMHQSVPEDCKPIILKDGSPLQFPSPTQKIKPPKIFKGRA